MINDTLKKLGGNMMALNEEMKLEIKQEVDKILKEKQKLKEQQRIEHQKMLDEAEDCAMSGEY